MDFDFYGHQIVAHLAPEECELAATGAVDGHNVPVRHFGAVLSIPEWQVLADKLTAAGTSSRLSRTSGSKASRAAGNDVLSDPSGNAIELKAFNDLGSLFAK